MPPGWAAPLLAVGTGPAGLAPVLEDEPLLLLARSSLVINLRTCVTNGAGFTVLFGLLCGPSHQVSRRYQCQEGP